MKDPKPQMYKEWCSKINNRGIRLYKRYTEEILVQSEEQYVMQFIYNTYLYYC